MLDTADDVMTDNTCWTPMAIYGRTRHAWNLRRSKDEKDILDTDGNVRTNKKCLTLLMK